MASLLSCDNALLLVIDIQDKFKPIVFDPENLIENTRRLIEACKLLGVPIVVSEQYPQGLGHTVPELKNILPPEATILEKTSFGCYDDAGIQAHLKSMGRKQVIVCGLEAHVCVNQTVIRLLEEGYQVYLVEDAVGARSKKNFKIARRKLEAAGATPSCVEMALFELMRQSSHPQFKAVQALIK